MASSTSGGAARWRGRKPDRPDTHFDAGLQHERTSMAWERTAFSMLAAGAVLTRYAAGDGFYFYAAIGAGVVVTGTALLIWSGHHYDRLHGPLRAGQSPVHPSATRIVGTATTLCAAAALAFSTQTLISHGIDFTP